MFDVPCSTNTTLCFYFDFWNVLHGRIEGWGIDFEWNKKNGELSVGIDKLEIFVFDKFSIGNILAFAMCIMQTQRLNTLT